MILILPRWNLLSNRHHRRSADSGRRLRVAHGRWLSPTVRTRQRPAHRFLFFYNFKTISQISANAYSRSLQQNHFNPSKLHFFKLIILFPEFQSFLPLHLSLAFTLIIYSQSRNNPFHPGLRIYCGPYTHLDISIFPAEQMFTCSKSIFFTQRPLAARDSPSVLCPLMSS